VVVQLERLRTTLADAQEILVNYRSD